MKSSEFVKLINETNKFETNERGYWCEVGDVGRQFDFTLPAESDSALRKAKQWFIDQINFQDPEQSLERCRAMFIPLKMVVDKLTGFRAGDYRFLIDENRQTLALLFGSLLVYDTNEGYNIEIVTNWLTKEILVICTGVDLSATAHVINNSPASRTFRDIEPGKLHLSNTNRTYLFDLCGAK